MRRSLVSSTFMAVLACVAPAAFAQAIGCTATPCVQPAVEQAGALFRKVEQLYPQLFFPPGKTANQLFGADTAFYRLYGTAPAWGLATYQGGIWYNNGKQWLRYLSLDDANKQFCASACFSSTVAGSFAGNVILGSPTDTSVGMSLYSAEQSGTVIVEYGRSKGTYSDQTQAYTLAAGTPLKLRITALNADTAYYYRLKFKAGDGATYINGAEGTFHTARAAGSSFTFTIQADSHMDENSVTRMYQQTLANVLAEQPDFHIDLGDTFMTEKHYAPLSPVSSPAANSEEVLNRYVFERNNFANIAHSVPLFLANGNHEGEAGWLNTGSDNIALWTSRVRQQLFMNPQPNSFYSGDASDTGRSAWYSWQWGDALFIVLDPYWYSARIRGGDGWAMTLGSAQYQWLEQTLRDSRAAYKFVFLHSLVGGLDGQMRGGIEAAPFFEWGGYESDGVTKSFAAKRPGWTAPIHDLLVRYGVTAVFHGHDHLYVKQDLDGIVYQEVPQPSALNTNNASTLARDYHYSSGVTLSSAGHLRVTVTPTAVNVAYVRTWLPEQENAQRKNGQIDHQWTVQRKP